MTIFGLCSVYICLCILGTGVTEAKLNELKANDEVKLSLNFMAISVGVCELHGLRIRWADKNKEQLFNDVHQVFVERPRNAIAEN